jgi:hypothetical protein
MKLRWDNYFMSSSGSTISFWTDYFKNQRDVLMILGIGFDPRTTEATKQILSCGGTGKRSIVGLRYFGSEDEEKSTNTSEPIAKHIAEIEEFINIKKFDKLKFKSIILRSSEEINISSINATKLFNKIEELDSYSDVIVDISAMPRGIFIPLINKLLNLIDTRNAGESPLINLHVVVTENPILDSKIEDQGTAEEATYIHGFKVNETTVTQDHKKVWIPILGETQTSQFELIRKSIDPVETCPVLPFPSKKLRRGDELINEYRDLLFNDSDFEPKNIVYGDEDNPFQVYRLLDKTIRRYDKSFKLLNGCKIIVSALSSKLLSLGAFMAVYEAKKNGKNVGMKQVESLGHKIQELTISDLSEILKENNLIHLWLAGEPYIA